MSQEGIYTDFRYRRESGLQKNTIDALGGLTSTRRSTEDTSLIVVDGPEEGKRLHLDKELIRIGRAEWCDLILTADPWVSNVHCEIWLEEEGLRIRDLVSRNGIRVNGLQVFDAFLPPGAKLEIGQSTIELRSHNQKREIEVHYADESGTLIGRSQGMRKIFSMLSRLKKSDISVSLQGETGTGKTSVARALHLQSERKDGPFVVVNCGALPANLIEAALFGHEKGAFTGADRRHLGFFQQANGGTLFFDEVAELPLSLQPKLLDVLERRVIRRLGDDKEIPVDFRLITATHRDLRKLSKEGSFREDLFFRISVVELEIPPLRDRREDIPLLTEGLLKETAQENTYTLTKGAMDRLQSFIWPGNVRQLRNTLEGAVALLDGKTIDVEDLNLPENGSTGDTDTAPPIRRTSPSPPKTQPTDNTFHAPSIEHAKSLLPLKDHEPPLQLKEVLKETERFLIMKAMEETDGHAPEAARLLGLSESWLYSRLRLYGMGRKNKK
ncbi:MAG: AAA family ATPase [Deltaproteobacteria bacterium]|nr:AAA family ATPase [Deltaproteobacteria bacterium]